MPARAACQKALGPLGLGLVLSPPPTPKQGPPLFWALQRSKTKAVLYERLKAQNNEAFKNHVILTVGEMQDAAARETCVDLGFAVPRSPSSSALGVFPRDALFGVLWVWEGGGAPA